MFGGGCLRASQIEMLKGKYITNIFYKHLFSGILLLNFKENVDTWNPMKFAIWKNESKEQEQFIINVLLCVYINACIIDLQSASPIRRVVPNVNWIRPEDQSTVIHG